MKRVSCYSAVLLCLSLGDLGAQEPPAVAAGMRVRITEPDGSRDGGPGILEAIDSTTIVVRHANGARVALPRERDTRLEVSWGPGACGGGRRVRCTIIGLMGGVALGVLAHLRVAQTCNAGACGVAWYATIPAGAVLGTIVGEVFPAGEHWTSVELPSGLSVGPSVTKGPPRFRE